MKYNRRKTSYPFVLDDYNLIDDVYHAVRDNERVVFLVRHGERWFDYSPEWGLIESWIQQAKTLWKRLQWWRFKDTSNDYYWSTWFKRTVQTSYYVWLSRWYDVFLEDKLDWECRNSYEEIEHPIQIVNYDYYEWDAAVWYIENKKEERAIKSEKMIPEICEMTKGHDFSWITTHDVVVIPLVSWLVNDTIKFSKKEWINYLSWVAIIINDEDWEFEIFPIRSLKEKSMVAFD